MALQKDNPNTRCFAAKHLKGNRKGWVAHNRTESSVLIVSLPPCRPFLTVLFYPYRALLILWRWMPRDKHWWVQGTGHQTSSFNHWKYCGVDWYTPSHQHEISMRSAWSHVAARISKLPLYWGALQLFINPTDATSVQEHREALERVQYAWTFDTIWPRNAWSFTHMWLMFLYVTWKLLTVMSSPFWSIQLWPRVPSESW